MLKIVTNSQNRKLGDTVISTYRQVGATCPSSCALLGKGCYAQKGFTRISSDRSANSNDSFDLINKSGKTLVRHHVSGDVFKDNQIDKEYISNLINFHKNNKNKIGWLYTHDIKAWVKAGFSSEKIPDNLTVIASCDNQEQIDYATKNNFRYSRVTTEKKLNQNEKLCPFDAALQSKKIDDIKVNCQSCGLCFKQNKTNIVFLKH